MIDVLLLLSLAITFFCSVVLTGWWIERARQAGLVGKDMHKLSKRSVAEVGGLPVLFAFLLGVFVFIGIRTFFFQDKSLHIEILAIVSTVTIIAIIGLIDDILGWKIGLKQWQKPILCLFAALPIMMINSAVSVMDIPFFGIINLGLLYPLIVVPIIISGAANGFNMLAGYNGLEAGQGVLILGALGFVVWQISGVGYVAMIAGIMVCALLGFLIFNKYPARVFPGDTLTYMVGAMIAIVAILGNAEKAALILFIPYIMEFLLKLNGGFKKESFSKVDEEGRLRMPYDRIYGLEHLAVFIVPRATERKVVYFLHIVQIVFVLIVFILIFMGGN